MTTPTTHSERAPTRLSADFWKFWAGQTISNLGSSFTAFALPLLVYNLTGSAMNLAISSAATFLPYLLFGLVIGAWVDRLNRKRLMIVADLLNAAAIASIPLLAMLGMLSVCGSMLWAFSPPPSRLPFSLRSLRRSRAW